jgi:hypothetical protein
MTSSAYPGARSVAPRIQAQFARHVAAAGLSHADAAAIVPELAAIETLIDAAFWASLRSEERYVSKISLALVSPQQTAQPLIFDRPLPLEAAILARVAPAVERQGIHLGVWRQGGELRVWGITRTVPVLSLVLEVAAPGLLVVKHHRGEVGKFANVAVLDGDQIKVVDEAASSLPDCPTLLTSLLQFDSRSWTGGLSVLVQLAVSMRAHRHGGLLIVVPSTHTEWLSSFVQPISYDVSPPFTALAELVRRVPPADEQALWREQLADAVDAVAGLTAVDGATILNDQYDVVAFGAKITRRRGSVPVERVAVTEPVESGVAAIVHATSLGGTRHLSAAQLVYDQRDTLALVASQDGNFTVFAWSPCQDTVHAHRVETLLL